MKIKNRIMLSNLIDDSLKKKIIIPIVISSLIIIGIFSFNKTINNYLYKGVMKEYSYNNLFIIYPEVSDPNDLIEKLKKIEHIESVFMDYEDHYSVYLKKIGNKDSDGSFFLIGLDIEELKKLTNKPIKENSMVCPSKFYPDDYIEGSHFIKRDSIIDLNKHINDPIEIYYYQYKKSYESEEKNTILDLVDTYKNNPNIIDENYCYVNRNLISNIYKDAYKYIDLSHQSDSIMVTLDSQDNLEFVEKKIKELNCSVSASFILDKAFFHIVKILCFFLSAISIIYVTVVIVSTNKRNILDKARDFSVLKCLGYSKRELVYELAIEQSLLFIFTICIVVLILCLIVIALKIILGIYPFIFSKVPISIDIIPYVAFVMFIIIILTMTNLKYGKEIINSDIIENLED